MPDGSSDAPDQAAGDDGARADIPAVAADKVDLPHRRPLIRAVLFIVAALVVGYGSWLLLQRGIHTDDFPPFLAGETSTAITRYSGPWLTAAAGAALLAALLVLWAAVDLIRLARAAPGSDR